MLLADLSNLWAPTLARGSDDGLGKLIFFGIVLVVWAGGAIVKSMRQAAAKRAANRPPSGDWQAASFSRTAIAPPPIPPRARRPQARRFIPPPPVPREVFAPPPLPLSQAADAMEATTLDATATATATA